ncbi:MAG TPA: VWA domain-containing protein [Thermoanaerobaculia bacterium]|nr:VWA domain-containing protein [Thermoanaerobaculia bacterium]
MRPRNLLPILLLLPAFAHAQTFQEKVTVTYIEVPVTVIGKGSAPVRGLTKENFEIYEDGAKRAIQSFEMIDFAARETLKSVSPLNPASRRNFLLLFDLSYSSPISVQRAQDAARNFITRSVGRRDLVAVAAMDVERGYRFLTAFTSDRVLLDAAIRDPKNFRAFDPLQISSVHGIFTEQGEPLERGADVGARGMNADDVIADLKRTVTAMDDSYRRSRVKRQVETLAELAHSLQKLAGRKHLVLLSEGFDPRLVQGRLVADTKEQTEENQAVQSGEIWKVDSDRRFGNASTQRSIAIMAEEFSRADVVLHAVDIAGVRVQNDITSGARVSSNEGLFLLASSTGGTVFRNSNDISGEFDNLSRQHEVVYVLGFQAPVGRAGEYHDLKVKLVNVPGARVRHRGGYYEAGNESAIERSLTTAEIIVNDIPQTDIDVAAMATAFPTGTDRAQVPVILEIAGEDLVKHAKNGIATTEIFIYAFDDEGLVRDALIQRMTLEISKVGDRLRQSGVKFYGTLSLPPGNYAIKSLVKVAESDRKGYQRVNVSVPGAGDVAVLQPFFFEEPGEWVMVKGGSNDRSKAPYPFVLNGESFIPAAKATLRRGEPRLFTVWVYNAEPEELTWEIAPEAKLVSETGGDITKLVFALERVPAGAKELGVTIRRKGSTDERRVSVPIFPR